jgi:hypothetical protein
MGLKADFKYHGTVASGSQLMESSSGTPGFQVMLECEDGNASFVIWLTEKNRKNADKYLKVLELDQSKLQDTTYLEYGLGQEIEGRKVTFGTKAEEYNGKTTVRVSWIGKASSDNLARTVSKYFGGNPPETKPVITDEDIPF